MEPGETPDPGESPTWGTSTLKVVLGSTTLDAAILYYFGWLRTNANAARIGLDPSVFGFDAEDYILRSAPAVLASVGVIVIAGALAKLVGSSTTRAIERGGWRSNVSDRSMRTVAGFAGATGVGVTLLGFRLGLRNLNDVRLVSPLLLFGGAALLWISSVLWVAPEGTRSFYRTNRQEISVLVGGIGVVAVSMLLSSLAIANGRTAANRSMNCLMALPAATVYADAPIPALARYEHTTVDNDTGETTGYTYSGLRFMAETNGRWFLPTPGFSNLAEGSSVMAMVPVRDDLQIVFSRPEAPDGATAEQLRSAANYC